MAHPRCAMLGVHHPAQVSTKVFLPDAPTAGSTHASNTLQQVGIPQCTALFA